MSDFSGLMAAYKTLERRVGEMERRTRRPPSLNPSDVADVISALGAQGSGAGEWVAFTPHLYQDPDYIAVSGDGGFARAAYCFIAPGLMHVMVEVRVSRPNHPTVTTAGGTIGSAIGVYPPDGFRLASFSQSGDNFSTYVGGSYVYWRNAAENTYERYSGSVFVDFGFMWLADWEQGGADPNVGDRWVINENDHIFFHCTLPYVIQDPSQTWGP